MKKLITSLFLLLSALFFNTEVVTFAKEIDFSLKEKSIGDHIDNNVSNINLSLSKLDKSSSLDEIESIINNYYANNKLSEYIFENKDLSINNTYLSGKSMDKNNSIINNKEVLNLEEMVSYAKENSSEEVTIYEFSNENSNTEVYVSKTGSIIILERSSIPELKNSSELSTLSTMKYTGTERTTGILYNNFGGKLATLWAEGSFKYDGETVDVLNKKGNAQKHPLGSLLTLSRITEGDDRPAYVGFNRYVEVYTSAYFESNVAFTFGNITLKSGTIEVYVGAAPSGSIYGGLNHL